MKTKRKSRPNRMWTGMLLFCSYLLYPSIVKAEDEEHQSTSPQISGFIETTYNLNFAFPLTNSLRSYDARANQILLNNAHFSLSGSSKVLMYTAEIDFGTDASVHGLVHQGISGINGGPIGVDIQEAYITYQPLKEIGLTVGRFVTLEGIEVIEGPANPTISRGYLFGLAEPFSHVGGYFKISPSDSFFIKLGAINGWDLFLDNNNFKTIISEIGFNFDPVAFDIAYYVGAEQPANNTNLRHSVDLTGITKIIPNVDLWFQGNYGTERKAALDGKDASWYGFGLQPLISLTDSHLLGVRYELFSDSGGARTGTSELLAHNLSIVPTYKLNSFMLRGEYRLDLANKEAFLTEKGTSKTSNTVSLGFSYNF